MKSGGVKKIVLIDSANISATEVRDRAEKLMIKS